MPLGCGLSVCKWILGFFNFIIFVCGGVVLGVGIWIAVDKSSMIKILRASEALSENPTIQEFNQPSVLEQAAYILIAAGAIVFLLGFLGCCGACQESKCMLATYGVFLTIFLIVEIGVGVYAAVSKNKFDAVMKDGLLKSLEQYTDPPNAITTSWNSVFAEMGCCGVNDYRDLPRKTLPIPPACCKLNDPADFNSGVTGCTIDPTGLTNNMNKGCYTAFEEWLKKHMTIVIAVACGLGGVQILAVIFAFCLCCALDGK